MVAPPPTERWAFLKTRLGRRLFVAFAWAAMTPIGVLALLSWVQVGDELHRQSRDRLHQAARASGMRIIEKLNAVEAELADTSFEDRHPRFLDRIEKAVVRLDWWGLDGSVQSVLGVQDNDDRLKPPAAGVRLETIEAPDRTALWLLVAAGEAGEGWAAQLDPAALFDHGPTNVLPVAGEFCVEAGDRRLGCSFEDPLPQVRAELREGAPGFESWTVAGEPHLGVRWPLFLQARYGVPTWTVTVSEPRAIALAAASTFRRLIPPTVVLAALVLAIVTAIQIRRRLVPLENLTEGTRRIAAGDFSFDVEIDGDDELAELADAFRSMTERVSSQFESMEQLIEVDRQILASNDLDELLEFALEALSSLYPAPRLAIHHHAPRASVASLIERSQDRVDRREIQLASEPATGLDVSPYRVLDPALVPIEISAGRDSTLAVAIRFPMQVGVAGYGALWVWLSSRSEIDPGKSLLVSQFASQLAAALHGLSLRGERERLLNFDGRTGLLNATGLRGLVRERIAEADERGTVVALAEVSLQGIDRVARTSGRSDADRLVRKLAEAVTRETGAQVGRLGDDTILAVFDTTERTAVPAEIRIIGKALYEALETEDREHSFEPATGVAVYPTDGDGADALMQKASQACRHAVGSASAEVAFFSSSMQVTAQARAQIERDLAAAVSREELRLFYQPILDAHSREVVAAEALVRWQHPERGLIPPDEFIPIAEESGLIQGIGSFVMRRACEDLAAWSARGLAPIHVSVNVATAQIRAGNLLSEVQGALSMSGASASSLGIELTESSLVAGDLATHEMISAVRRLGVAVSIDDFGTGYSSLSYLRRLPVDILKLDRSFLEGVPAEVGASALVLSILAMAQTLHLTVVVEGVETYEQLEFLRGAGCDRVQGYLFARPLAEPEFLEFLAKGVDLD